MSMHSFLPLVGTTLLVASSGSIGCFTIREAEGKAAAPVPLSVAVADFEDNLNRLGVLVLSDARFKNSQDKTDVARIQRIKDVIADAQCYDWIPDLENGKPKITKNGNAIYKEDVAQRTKNPLVPVISGAVQVQVQGQFSEQGAFTVSTTQGLQGGATLTRQAQQQVMLPIALVSLANLDKFYIGQQLTNLQYLTLTAEKAPYDEKGAGALVKDVLEVGHNLKVLADEAMDGFAKDTASYCQGHGRRHARVLPPGAAGFDALNE